MGGSAAAVLVLLLGTALAVGCGGPNRQFSGATGSGGSGGASSSSGTGTGGMGGQGTGGSGTGGSGMHGPSATDLVNAGATTKSASYTMISTLGQSTQNQGKTTSPSYRMQGGLIGANGSLP